MSLYTPPEGLCFRLKNKSTGYVLYSRLEVEDTFSHYGGGIVSDDQWWYLIPGTGEHQGSYLLKSKVTDKDIFSRKSPDPKVGHVGGNGKYNDNYFCLEQGSGDRKSWFRLKNCGSDTVIFSRTTAQPYLGNVASSYTKSDDQYWSFEFEDMVFESIKYYPNNLEILSEVPRDLGDKTIKNNTSNTQTLEMTIAYTTSFTYSWQVEAGWRFALSTENKATIPGLGEGKIMYTMEVSVKGSYGRSRTKTKTESVTDSVVANPHTMVTGTLSATHVQMRVPSTLCQKSASTGYKVCVDGVYEGAQYYKLVKELKEVKI